MPLQSAFNPRPIIYGYEPPPPVANKNWNPGDWLASGTDGTGQDAIWSNPTGNPNTRGLVERLEAIPQYRGVMLRYSWDQLERNQGEYEWTETINNVVYKRGMAQIAERLARIATIEGRRVGIFIQSKTFGASNHAVPKYIREDVTGVYEDGTDYYQTTTPKGGATTRQQGSLVGEYAYVSGKVPPGPGGYVPNFHVAAVKTRFLAMIAAFASRFANSPYIEFIAFTEASIAFPVGAEGAATQVYPVTPSNPIEYTIHRPNTNAPAGWPDTGNWLTAMKDIWQSMTVQLPNQLMCQWINADRGDMETWVPQLLALPVPIGIGMPDFCKDTRGFCFTPPSAPGNIYWMNQSPTSGIRITHMSIPAMEGSVADGAQTVANASPGQFAYHGLNHTRLELAAESMTVVPTTHRLWRHQAANHVLNTNYIGQNFNAVTDANMAAINSTYDLRNKPRPDNWL